MSWVALRAGLIETIDLIAGHVASLRSSPQVHLVQSALTTARVASPFMNGGSETSGPSRRRAPIRSQPVVAGTWIRYGYGSGL